MIDYLTISWGTSKGRDTYGYNICRLDSRTHGHRFRCMGGGYDMLGTVLGQYLKTYYQAELLALANDLQTKRGEHAPYGSTGWVCFPNHYGMTYNPKTNTVLLDGACGVSCMQAIARSIGFDIEQHYDKRKKRVVGYFVSKAD